MQIEKCKQKKFFESQLLKTIMNLKCITYNNKKQINKILVIKIININTKK